MMHSSQSSQLKTTQNSQTPKNHDTKQIKDFSLIEENKSCFSESNEILRKVFEDRRAKLPTKQRSFSPFVTHGLELPGRGGIYRAALVYNQKYNLMICCSGNRRIYFYDATTLKESRSPLEFYSPVHSISYCPETETYVFEIEGGNIYSYNMKTRDLKKEDEGSGYSILELTYLHSMFYIVSREHSLEIRNLESGSCKEIFSFSFWEGPCLHYLEKSKGLLLGYCDSDTETCKMVLSLTNKLPELSAFCSIGHHKVEVIKSMVVNGKEYFLTTKRWDQTNRKTDWNIKIWNLSKGKIRLLKVIQFEEPVFSFVGLEMSKMIAVTFLTKCVKFYSIISGKLELTLTLNAGVPMAANMFLLKDRDCLWVADGWFNSIYFVQLSDGKGKKTVYQEWKESLVARKNFS